MIRYLSLKGKTIKKNTLIISHWLIFKTCEKCAAMKPIVGINILKKLNDIKLRTCLTSFEYKTNVGFPTRIRKFLDPGTGRKRYGPSILTRRLWNAMNLHHPARWANFTNVIYIYVHGLTSDNLQIFLIVEKVLICNTIVARAFILVTRRTYINHLIQDHIQYRPELAIVSRLIDFLIIGKCQWNMGHGLHGLVMCEADRICPYKRLKTKIMRATCFSGSLFKLGHCRHG